MVSCGLAWKLNVTCLSESRVKAQVPEPVHSWLQPEKYEPVSALAVRVTEVPPGKLALHTVPCEPQLIPAGVLVTFPLPPVWLLLRKMMNGPAADPPERLSTCGLHAASSLMLSAALRAPPASGA